MGKGKIFLDFEGNQARRAFVRVGSNWTHGAFSARRRPVEAFLKKRKSSVFYQKRKGKGSPIGKLLRDSY